MYVRVRSKQSVMLEFSFVIYKGNSLTFAFIGSELLYKLVILTQEYVRHGSIVFILCKVCSTMH